MPEQGNPAGQSLLKKPSLYSGALLVIIALFVVYVLMDRWIDNRVIERRLRKERAQKQREEDLATLERMGGKELAIQSFYATPAAIHRGESIQLCYGVANGKTVTLEPQPNPVWPSYARCVEVSPTRTTTYTLTVGDASGHSLTQSLTVTVQ